MLLSRERQQQHDDRKGGGEPRLPRFPIPPPPLWWRARRIPLSPYDHPYGAVIHPDPYACLSTRGGFKLQNPSFPSKARRSETPPPPPLSLSLSSSPLSWLLSLSSLQNPPWSLPVGRSASSVTPSLLPSTSALNAGYPTAPWLATRPIKPSPASRLPLHHPPEGCPTGTAMPAGRGEETKER